MGQADVSTPGSPSAAGLLLLLLSPLPSLLLLLLGSALVVCRDGAAAGVAWCGSAVCLWNVTV
jgi:hypothetical protein